MAADTLAPCVARSSAAMILTISNVDILIVLLSEFQQLGAYQYRVMMWNENIFLCDFSKKIQHDKGYGHAYFSLLQWIGVCNED